MAKKGRKPKPRAQREFEGNRGHRPLPSEPKMPVGTTCPSWLSRGAKNEWRRVYPLLTETRVLTRADRAAFAAYCVAYDRWQTVELVIRKFLAKHSTLTYQSKTGVVKPIPEIAIANASQDQMRKWAAELGITPSSRSRVGASGAGDAEASPLAEFLRGGGPRPQEAEDKPN